MKRAFPILFVLTVILAIAQSVTIHLLDENLEVAALIIVSTEHQRDEARGRVQQLEQVIIEQNEQCTDGPPRLYRGPYYFEQDPHENQEDTPPVSC
jgi:hypothetical protein